MPADLSRIGRLHSLAPRVAVNLNMTRSNLVLDPTALDRVAHVGFLCGGSC